MARPELVPVTSLAAGGKKSFDAVVAVGMPGGFGAARAIDEALSAAAELDARVGRDVVVAPASGLPGGRLIHAPTGGLDRDQDDVRCFGDAARAGLRRARDAGAVAPVVVLGTVPGGDAWANALPVTLLGALAGLWEPLEAREALGEAKVEPVKRVGFLVPEGADGKAVARWVAAVEDGRRLARDMGGTEPERMAPPRMAELCEKAFADTRVKVEVLEDARRIRSGYPLLAAVARASFGVKRHHPRVVRLTYEGGGKIERTLLLAGKGLSYDTGGADLKVGGSMAGMSRDKGGGAAVAGFLATVAALAPKNLRVIAEIGCVRNSIGADAFVSDEIVTAHSGCRVRIGNTDAEGRLVLADLLSHLREDAKKAKNPLIFTCATLTGHAGRAVGPYTIAMDNRPARDIGVAELMARVGDAWGDPVEISRLRREDWAFVAPRSRADDVLSCNNAPSTLTSRGHQFPMAFLAIASGLDRHGPGSDAPLPFTHVDIGGAANEGSDWQHGRPTATPIPTLTAAFAGTP